MNPPVKNSLLLFLFLVFNYAGKAEKIIWNAKTDFIDIAERIELLEDTQGKLNIDQVNALALKGKFRPSKQKVLHFGFTSSVYWLKFSLQNLTSDSLLLVLEQAVLPVADLYFKDKNGNWLCYKAGYDVNLNKKIIRNHFQVYPLSGANTEYYIKLISYSPPVPVKIWRVPAYEEISTDQKINYGLYTGILLFVILYNTFLFFSLGKFTYLHYALQVLLYLLCSAAVMDGYIIYFFPGINLTFLYYFIPLLGMANLSVYALLFLDIKTYAPDIYKFSVGVVIYFVSYVFWCFLLPQHVVLALNQVHALASLGFMFLLGLKVGRNKYKLGYYFALAYLIYFSVVIIEIIYIQTGAPTYFFRISHVSIAILIEAILLTYLLSKRFSWEKQEIEVAKQEAQTLLLKKTLENEQLVRNQNVRLEETVKQRTKEIEHQKEIAEDALAAKEVLLKEIHHRVKNNLQTISSMLMLQSSTLGDSDAKEALLQSQSRVRSIAVVHQKLYQNDGLEKVELNGLVDDLTAQVKSLYQLQAKKIEVKQNIPETHIFIDKAIPIGLIINELLTNSYKHAFTEIETGSILITFEDVVAVNEHGLPGSKKVRLTYFDSGKGIASPDMISSPSRLGLRLVNLLSLQIGAVMEYSNKRGSKFVFTFDITL